MIEINKILNAKAGRRLSSVDCLDIMNIIGKIVVAGNVRRSAQIALGDHDDIEYLRAKRWDSVTSRTGGPCPTTLLCVTTSASSPKSSGMDTRVMVSLTD